LHLRQSLITITVDLQVVPVGSSGFNFAPLATTKYKIKIKMKTSLSSGSIVPLETIERRIFLIRGQKVILDFHIAELYQVETKALKRAVKRNRARFPSDFLFELTQQEYTALRYQLGTLKRGEHSKYLPFAFTEQGIAMLSGILVSPRAVQVNIAIMRSFVKLREVLATHKDLVRKLVELENKYDAQFQIVFDAIRQILTPPEKPKHKIGFRVKETVARYNVKRTRLNDGDEP
jgi:hypothetical protein